MSAHCQLTGRRPGFGNAAREMALLPYASTTR